MRLASSIAAILSIVFVCWTGPASANQTFGGYDCTVDCSGHKAGYEWAEARGVTDSSVCEQIIINQPNRTSFYEGCLAYVDDPLRGADEDDDGQSID
jgi:hypothetical protein